MVNPTIYTLCIKQFWATAKTKTVNGEVQIQALVDGKKVIVTETSVRRALQLKDVEGTECLPNATIFAELERMSANTTAWNEFSSTMASAIICLTTNQKFNFSKYIFDNMVKNLEGGVKFLMYPSSTKPITDEAANEEHVPIHSNDPLLSKITNLKEMVKKLERRNKSRTLGLERLRNVGRSTQVVSSEDESLGAQEDASKQGRKIADLDDDAEEVEVKKVVSATTTIVDELTLAQTLIEIKAVKPKAVTTATTTTTTVVTRPKARGVVVQEPKLQVELEEEERLARQKEEEYNLISWDNTQAMMEADYELAQRLQAEERGELTIEERSKLFVELMDKRKKHFAKLRAKEIRRKPPTKAQKRNQMYSFVPMDKEVVEESKSQAEGSFKRTREELESDNLKKQKIDENVEAEVDDEAEMKKLMEIVPDDEVAIDAIPLPTKSLIIVDWKIIKEGKMGYYQIIRADGSSRRLEEEYERVLWGDLKVMFEPGIESEV
ncbi:hypothetical protein Tco_0758227 [Tanacetum coccineum]